MKNIIETSRQYYANQMRNRRGPFVRYARTEDIVVCEFFDQSMGYAPAERRGLFEHLKGQGFSEEEIVESGLCIRNKRGKVYDRFRGVMLDMFTDDFRPI